MGTFLNPDRKFICKNQIRDWMLVRINTIEKVLKRAPWTPFSALNISRGKWRKLSKLCRIQRNLEKSQKRKLL